MKDQFTEALEKSRGGIGVLKGFGYRNDTEDDKIEKSHIEQIFEHDAAKRGFVIDKRGKEIKEKLRKMLEEEERSKSMLEIRIDTLRAHINEDPDVDIPKDRYYLVDGWMEKMSNIPDLYSWDKINSSECPDRAKEDSGLINADSGPSNTMKKPCGQKMQEYNDCVYKYIDCQKEIAMLNTMLSNFKDDAIYSLTVREATLLGW